MEVRGQRHARLLNPGTETRLPLYRWLGRHQSQSVRKRKISPPLGFHPRTVQPIASHCTDCAILTNRHPYTLLKLICIFHPLLGFPNGFLPSRGFLPTKPISTSLTLWWVCIKLCKGYYHWDHLSSFCHRMPNLPDTGGYNAALAVSGGILSRRSSVK